jgi:hypothetical protein
MLLFDPVTIGPVQVKELTASAGFQFVMPQAVSEYNAFIRDGYSPTIALALTWMKTLISDDEDNLKLFYLYNFHTERMEVFSSKMVGMIKVEYVPLFAETLGAHLVPANMQKVYLRYMLDGYPEQYAVYHTLLDAK